MSTVPAPQRLQIDVHYRTSDSDSLALDVRRGLSGAPKTLHPKYLYDARGSQLFDQICDTPEYYPTRTEQALLEQVSAQIVRRLSPHSLVELGSGASRKTRALLDALNSNGRNATYVPVDVSEEMLRDTASSLLADYPWLEIHGVVADYTTQLEMIPRKGSPSLFVFLGSTIGNFPPRAAVDFLRNIRKQMLPGDYLLLGTDLVKDHEVLNAAYNDRQGITQAFNKNVLARLNRELGADFDLGKFEHVAAFNPESRQIEMHLRSRVAQRVRFHELDWEVGFSAEESILTEISRKFTEEAVASTLDEAGLHLDRWYTPDNGYFALSLSRPVNGG